MSFGMAVLRIIDCRAKGVWRAAAAEKDAAVGSPGQVNDSIAGGGEVFACLPADCSDHCTSESGSVSEMSEYAGMSARWSLGRRVR